MQVEIKYGEWVGFGFVEASQGLSGEECEQGREVTICGR